MSIKTFSYWLAATPFSLIIQRTHGAIAVIQILHIICLATLFALALSLALRFAGRGLVAEPLESLAERFVPAMWVCLSLLLLTGSLLIIAEPYRTLNKAVFYLKMSLLLLAIFSTLRIAALARRTREQATAARKTAAALYMLIWCGIIVAGRMIAYR